jgi:DNA-binding response OmpR family regulator
MTLPRARLLVADDDPEIRANLKDILQDLDYHVDVAADGPAALALARTSSYDLVLLDLRMPGMDGLETYRQLKRSCPGTPVIVVTAYATTETASQLLGSGACGLLPKPVEVPRLIQAIEAQLSRPLVLLVDDDREVCASLADVLTNANYRVAVAHDRRQALSALDAHPFDVLIVDMKLPETDGLRLFREARKRVPGLRAVFITGFRAEMQDLLELALAENADAVCYKPLDLDELLAHLRKLVPQA